MSRGIYTQDEKPKMILFVSKYEHCLSDNLGRYSAGESPLEPFDHQQPFGFESNGETFFNPVLLCSFS